MASDNMSCEHQNFVVKARVTRLSDVDGGPITGYAADITIQCEACKMPFLFRGLRPGMSPSRPTMSLDGEEGRFPIVPRDERYVAQFGEIARILKDI